MFKLVISPRALHQGRALDGPRGLMDKASDFESEDCGFESRRGQLFLLKLYDNATEIKLMLRLTLRLVAILINIATYLDGSTREIYSVTK